MFHSLLRLALPLVALALAGCAAAPKLPERPVTPHTQAFELFGRVGVTYENEGFHGNLRWVHEPEREEVWILSPLGQTVAHLTKDARGAVLTTSQETYRAADLGALTQKVMGWTLPLEGLQYWVRGLTAPGDPGAVERDAAGRIARLEQNGWRVNYLRYGESGELPAKIRLSSPRLDITLVIDSWSAGS